MQKSVLAGRMGLVRQALIQILAAVATPEQLEALKSAQAQKRADVQALYELEALLPIIESLTSGQQTAVDVDSILAIEGLSKTSQKAIEAHFNGSADL